MFKKNLFVFVSLLLSGLLYAQPDTCCGWIGPITSDTCFDTGYVELSNEHTQGQYSTKFASFFGEQMDQRWYFIKDFDSMPVPDIILLDIKIDSFYVHSGFIALNVWINQLGTWSFDSVIIQDSLVFVGTTTYYPDSMGWCRSIPVLIDDSVSIFIDSLILALRSVQPIGSPVEMICLIDNVRGITNGDTSLIDGMGDQSAIEESFSSEETVVHSYPNPFVNRVNISYQSKGRNKVHLAIYSLGGQLIKTLVDKTESNSHAITWNGRNEKGTRVSSGIYFLRLEIGNYSTNRKLMLLH